MKIKAVIIIISLLGIKSFSQPNIIFDTDFGGDADDLGALAMLNHFVNNDECNLLAVMVCTTEEYAVPAIDAVNTFYGNADIPIGVRKDGKYYSAWNYSKVISDVYKYNETYDSALEATALYRKILSKSENGSVVIVTAGPLKNIDYLLHSKADSISPLSGKELVEAKVKEFVVMGGEFPQGKNEWNFNGDMPGVARRVIEDIPVPIVFSGYELGFEIRTAEVFNKLDKNHPLHIGYLHFSKNAPWVKERYQGQIPDHASFDQTAVLYAVKNGVGTYWTKVGDGVCVPDEYGGNIWIEKQGSNHAYLKLKTRKEELAKLIDSLMLGNLPVHYSPTWKSLSQHNIEPDWFKDAKFGIYFHWGPYTVPEFSNEWYPRWMYFKERKQWGGDAYPFHKEHYGEPEDFNYHDFIPMFKAEHFNAEEWAELFVASGAKFAGPVAQHHDGFAMWDSDINPNNSMDKGPQKDILGDVFKELKARDMKTIATFHHARNLQRYADDTTNWAGKGENVAPNSHYPFHPDYATSTTDPELKYLYGNIPADEFHEYWLNQVNEVVDKYAPDMIWFDSWLDLIPEVYRQKMLTHHYNKALSRGQEPVAFYKQEDLPDSVAILDIEQGGKTGMSENYWLTDITISYGSWSYTKGQKYKTPELVIRNMIDVWSKKGVVLLNVSPMANGIIPQEQQDVLYTIGKWIEKHEEAVYNTRAYSIFGYGVAEFEKGHFGGQSATMQYTKNDVRFTQSKNGKVLYIYLLGLPEVNEELAIQHVVDTGKEISSVSLVGSESTLEWKIENNKLLITAPKVSEMSEIANVFKVEF